MLCLDVEHHANLLPWRAAEDAARTGRCPRRRTVEETLAALEAALRATPTALLTVTGASNVTGEVLPLAADRRDRPRGGRPGRRRRRAARPAPPRRPRRDRGGLRRVLRAQALRALRRRGARSGAATGSTPPRPYLAGGGAVTQVDLDGATWAPAPHRHEAGTPNVLGVAALAQACRTLAPVLDGAGSGARARAARPARRRPGDGPRRDAAADLARQPGPGGGAELHGRGPPRRVRRGVPVGRARDRGARRPVLRAPAAGPPVPGLRGPAATAPRSGRASAWGRPPSTSTGWSARCASWSPAGPAGPTPPSAAAGRPPRTPATSTRWASARPGTAGTGCGHPG